MARPSSDNRRRLEAFALLFGAWVIFSGQLDAVHLAYGVVCAALVAAMSYDLLLPPTATPVTPAVLLRHVTYVPWLLWEVVLANLHLIYLILRPSEIRSQVVRFRTTLRSDLAKVTLANSITLTPGHDHDAASDDDEFVVHALSDKAAEDVRAAATWNGASGDCTARRRRPDSSAVMESLLPRQRRSSSWSSVLLAVHRVVSGPAIVDRIIGANVVGIEDFIAVILLAGHVFERVEFFVDIAIVYALTNFIGTLALSRYLQRKGMPHREDVAQ